MNKTEEGKGLAQVLALMPPDVRRALEKMKSLNDCDLGALEVRGADLLIRPGHAASPDDRKCLPLLASPVEAETERR